MNSTLNDWFFIPAVQHIGINRPSALMSVRLETFQSLAHVIHLVTADGISRSQAVNTARYALLTEYFTINIRSSCFCYPCSGIFVLIYNTLTDRMCKSWAVSFSKSFIRLRKITPTADQILLLCIYHFRCPDFLSNILY